VKAAEYGWSFFLSAFYWEFCVDSGYVWAIGFYFTIVVLDLALQLVGILGTVRNDFNSPAFTLFSSVCLDLAGDSNYLLPDADLLWLPVPANVLVNAVLNWSIIPYLFDYYSVFAFFISMVTSKLKFLVFSSRSFLIYDVEISAPSSLCISTYSINVSSI
jgi:hypothetical protein